MLDLLMVLPHAVVETLKISAPTVVEAARGNTDHGLYDRRLRGWAQRLVDYVGMKIEVHGREHLVAGETYVVMSNHQSVYDIPVVYLALPELSIRMVAKAGLFKIPIWGQALKTAGFVELDRANRVKAIKALNAARATMESGISIWIAPEGTRTRNGQLLPFKQGGFHLALETGARILPVTISGTRHVLPADSYEVRRGAEVTVTLHAPIDPAPYGKVRRGELITLVRETIGKVLPTDSGPD